MKTRPVTAPREVSASRTSELFYPADVTLVMTSVRYSLLLLLISIKDNAATPFSLGMSLFCFSLRQIDGQNIYT